MNTNLKSFIFNVTLMSLIAIACIIAMVIDLRCWIVMALAIVCMMPIFWKSMDDLNKWLRSKED